MLDENVGHQDNNAILLASLINYVFRAKIHRKKVHIEPLFHGRCKRADKIATELTSSTTIKIQCCRLLFEDVTFTKSSKHMTTLVVSRH